jgi:hypothetical protein
LALPKPLNDSHVPLKEIHVSNEGRYLKIIRNPFLFIANLDETVVHLVKCLKDRIIVSEQDFKRLKCMTSEESAMHAKGVVLKGNQITRDPIIAADVSDNVYLYIVHPSSGKQQYHRLKQSVEIYN